MKSKYILILLILIGIINKTYSQSISNVKTVRENNQIIVNYNLESNKDEFIGLYISEDGGETFMGPLKSVKGDVGFKVKPGANKKIVWDVLKDREFLVGDNFVFRIKAISLLDIFTDPRDGRTYQTIRIDSQVWMAENLAYKPENGNYWAYNNDQNNVTKFGYLYDWQTACNVCPTGWHLPSDAEWSQLTDFVGSNPGTKLKAKRGWISNGNGTDDYGFSALPGGYRNINGKFNTIGNNGYWWCSTELSTGNAWSRAIRYDNSGLGRGNNDKDWGFSVRCVRD